MIDNMCADLIKKRFQTTMIGSLYNFEEFFGHLWGLDKDEDELTNEELDFRDKWEETRNAILNNGNSQLRKCLADIEKCEGAGVKYTYKFNKRERR